MLKLQRGDSRARKKRISSRSGKKRKKKKRSILNSQLPHIEKETEAQRH